MKIAVVLLIKNEHSYLKEWIEYYLNLGVTHLFIGEDYGSDTHKNITDEYSQVTLINVQEYLPNWDETVGICSRQIKFYDKVFQNHKKDFDWMGFFDVDEFVVIESGTLENFLKDYEEYEGVVLAWKNYGACGNIKQPYESVIKSYPYAIPVYIYDCQGKSFGNCKKLQKVEFMHAISHDCVDVFKNFSFKESLYCAEMGVPSNWKIAWINHYFTKSWEDWLKRMLRGNMKNNYRTLDTFFEYNPDMEHLSYKLISEAAPLYNDMRSLNNVISRKYKIYANSYIKSLKTKFISKYAKHRNIVKTQ